MRTISCKALPKAAWAIIALGMLLVSAGSLSAQSFYGSVTGNVTDATGAIVPGAKVTLLNKGTNEKREAVADASGSYRFVNLVPTEYRLDVEASGFKHLSREPVTVRVESEVRIDAAMEIGATSETVEVSAETPLLQTESGAVSEAVEGQRVQEMPLNGRNTMNLVALTPGVVAAAPSGASALNMGTHTQNSVWSDYSIAGGFSGASAMYLDGGTVNLLGGNSIAFIPTQDAVQEFRIMSSAISPEYGRFGGGVINMTTKSGTNQWHGSVYEYFRNNVLNANDFFNNRNGVARGKWNQNQYGATLGNPILKDKLFSFFSWEGFRLLVGYPNRTFVPTADMLAGKFYSAKNAGMSDPLAAQTGRTGCVTTQTDAAGASYVQIAPACFDTTAKAMLNMKYWPTPNHVVAGDNYNFVATPVPTTGNNANQYTERVDWNVSPNQRIFARYTYWGQVDLPYAQLGNFTKNAYSHNNSTQAVVGDTYTINASTIADVRLAYVRQYTDNVPDTLGKDLSSLGGQWGTLQTQLSDPYMPGPHVLQTNETSGSLYPFFGMNVFSKATMNAYDLGFSVTKILSKHTLKAGGEIRLSDQNTPGFTLAGGGFFLFLGFPWLTGDGFGDFLMGTPGAASAVKLQPSSAFNWYQGYYVSDVWQATRKLTINAGVRWELPGAIGEKHDWQTVLMPSLTDSVTGAPGTLSLVNSANYKSRYIGDQRKNLFAPRFGFAYRLTDKDVIRGGYGITFLPPDMAMTTSFANSENISAITPAYSPVNSATTGWTNLPGFLGGNTATHGEFLTLSNPFPAKYYPNGLNKPVGRSSSTWTSSLLGQVLSGPLGSQPYAYSQQWNLSVGHQFKGDLMVEVNYNGSRSSNLPANIDLNQLKSQYWNSTDAKLSNTPYKGYYSDVVTSNSGVGISTYNAATVKVEKRFKSGGVLSGNYTYAKNLANVESPIGSSLISSAPSSGNYVGYFAQDSGHLRESEYSLSGFDIRNRTVVSYVLPLPFGEGQKWAQFKGLAGAAVSGWTINGITSIQNGFPLPLTQSTGSSTLNSYGYSIRPTMKAGCDPVIKGSGKDRLDKWFNTSCYSTTPDFTLGNVPRVDNKLRTDGTANWDISVMKATKIFSKFDTQFRAEFFNAFNHPMFAAPDNVVTDSGFGQVSNQMNSPRLVQFSLRINY